MFSPYKFWDRDDYIKEIYEEVCNDPGPLIRIIHKAIDNNRKRGDLNVYTIK